MGEQFSLFGDPEKDSRELFRVCGACRYFGEPNAYNFARCSIDAFGDGMEIHKNYQSLCKSYKAARKKVHAMALAESRGDL